MLTENATHQGLVEVFKQEGRSVLTWEECPLGRQYDESESFDTIDSLYEFLEESGLNPADFRP